MISKLVEIVLVVLLWVAHLAVIHSAIQQHDYAEAAVVFCLYLAILGVTITGLFKDKH